MKKTILLCGLLLAVSATVAAAAPGTNLRWGACLGDAGTINKSFLCNSNTATNSLAGSFELGADVLQSSGLEVVIDLASAGATLPAWWAFKNVGTCRTTALSLSTSISPLAVNCIDWAAAQATGGIGAYNIGARGPNTARMVAAIAVPASALADLFGATEYYAFNMNVSNAKTVGPGFARSRLRARTRRSLAVSSDSQATSLVAERDGHAARFMPSTASTRTRSQPSQVAAIDAR